MIVNEVKSFCNTMQKDQTKTLIYLGKRIVELKYAKTDEIKDATLTSININLVEQMTGEKNNDQCSRHFCIKRGNYTFFAVLDIAPNTMSEETATAVYKVFNDSISRFMPRTCTIL